MKNVVSFPEKQMKKARKEQKAATQQAVLSLSLVSLLLGALLLNETLLKTNRPHYLISDNTSASDIQNLNRAIANAQPMNPFRDLDWEKKMADRLGSDSLEDRTPASLGKKASTFDQLRFGPLAGKYRLVDTTAAQAVKIQEISYQDSDEVTDRPVFLDPEQFLKTYGDLLAVEFSVFDRSNPNQNQIREYRLLNDSKKVVGTAAFVMDDEGRFLSLKVRTAATPE
ncbi:MAG: hypothetical protein ACAH59_13175 [Pseudobdellovibrionaceae bacterium]